MARVFGVVVGIAGIISAIIAGLQYFSAGPSNPTTPAPMPMPTPAPNSPPITISLPPGPGPEQAVGTRVQMRSRTTAALTVMTMLNYDVSNIQASLWALSNGRLVKLDSRVIPFIESGGYAAADRLPTPFTIGKMVACVNYSLNNRNVEMLDFYTNEGHSQQQLMIGTMSKFRPSVVEVDGSGALCRLMPSSAARYL